MNRLVVWMYGIPIGILSRQRGSLVFTYTTEALQLGVGRPLLSVSMPTQRRAYRGDVVHAFFDGLLPEGEARRMIAYDFGIQDERETFALLVALGRDCAGALMLLPEGEEPPQGGEPEAMTDNDVAERIRTLRFHPLGVDQRVRVSLAGMQEKLLLARSGDSWALPIDGAPSTHILKPQHQLLAQSIENEALCMRVAANLGVVAAPVEVETFGDRAVLVVTRYDRSPDENGVRTIRIHQEDFCQAHGLDSGRKYEERGGPSARQCAELLRRWSRPEELERLLELLCVNVLVGNADAHAKNFSLIHGSEGDVTLAPAYDVMSTVHYAEVDLIAGMFVNQVREIDRITRSDLVDEAASWGLARAAAEEYVDGILGGAEEAIATAAAELSSPQAIVDTLTQRAAALRG